jgi:carboxyl-terminal processing protease
MKKLFLAILLCFLFTTRAFCCECDDVFAGFVALSDNGSSSVSQTFPLGDSIDVELLCEVLNTVYENHINRLSFDKTKMTKGIVEGLMQSLDKHSHYLDPKEAASQYEALSGVMVGSIGILFEVSKRYIKINEVVKGSPAEKSGLLAKDKIVEIDGKAFKNLQSDELVKKIKGAVGTSVSLSVLRRGRESTFEVSVTRDIFDVQSVDHRVMKSVGKKFGIIKIKGFNPNTYDQFIYHVTKIMKKMPDYIVFDLRDNPGGLVGAVRMILGDCVGSGKVLMQEEFWNGERKLIYSFSFTKNGIFKEKGSSVKGMICLVNENTASAAEIMSAGLRDLLGVKIVGETTYGKGTGWKPIELDSGKGVCNVTCFKWLTPNGYSIEEVGIDPDVIVFMDEEDVFLKKDPQLDAAIKELLKK